MLQTRTVYPDTLGLLKELMKEPLLGNHFLVGGTSLALQMGHRFSVDLDLFKHETTFHVVRSLVYFEDAEQTENPVLFDKSVTWDKVKKRLVEIVRANF